MVFTPFGSKIHNAAFNHSYSLISLLHDFWNVILEDILRCIWTVKEDFKNWALGIKNQKMSQDAKKRVANGYVISTLQCNSENAANAMEEACEQWGN